MFYLVSWTLQDYVAAIRYKPLYTSVQHVLDHPTKSRSTSKSKSTVEAKYHIVGGNARSMFTLATDVVIQRLDLAIRQRGYWKELRDTDVSLVAYDFHKASNEVERRVVSGYVALGLAVQLGPKTVLRLAQELSTDPSGRGTAALFLLWFLGSIANGGLAFVVQDHANGRLVTKLWVQQQVLFFDPVASSVIPIRGWHVPIQWTKRGYDAVYLETNPWSDSQHCCFVDVIIPGRREETTTRSKRFQAEPFRSVLFKLKDANWRVDSVELCYVVPHDQLLSFSLPVSEARFTKQVVRAVFPHGSVAVRVRVAGVEYPPSLLTRSSPFEQIRESHALPSPSPPSPVRGRTSKTPTVRTTSKRQRKI